MLQSHRIEWYKLVYKYTYAYIGHGSSDTSGWMPTYGIFRAYANNNNSDWLVVRCAVCVNVYARACVRDINVMTSALRRWLMGKRQNWHLTMWHFERRLQFAVCIFTYIKLQSFCIECSTACCFLNCSPSLGRWRENERTLFIDTSFDWFGWCRTVCVFRYSKRCSEEKHKIRGEDEWGIERTSQTENKIFNSCYFSHIIVDVCVCAFRCRYNIVRCVQKPVYWNFTVIRSFYNDCVCVSCRIRFINYLFIITWCGFRRQLLRAATVNRWAVANIVVKPTTINNRKEQPATAAAPSAATPPSNTIETTKHKSFNLIFI